MNASEQFASTSKRVLIADDDETFLLSTADLLRREGFEVEAVPNSAAAAQLLRGGSFDVLILDVNMSGNIELEFVASLVGTGANVPVILVTGYPSIRNASQAVGLSVLAFLIKPFDFALLLKHVREGVARSGLISILTQAHDRLKNWDRDLTLVRQSLDATTAGDPRSAVETFVLLSIQSVMGTLGDLKLLADSRKSADAERTAYELLRCPPPLQTLAGLRHAIDVLERTKASFKSKELAELRAYLEGLLSSGQNLS